MAYIQMSYMDADREVIFRKTFSKNTYNLAIGKTDRTEKNLFVVTDNPDLADRLMEFGGEQVTEIDKEVLYTWDGAMRLVP